MKNINHVIGCLHAPFHNKKVWYNVLKLAKDLEKKLQGIYLIEDILDLNSVSFHERGQYPLNGLTAEKEYKMVKVFDDLDSVLKKGVKKNFLYGNHENRRLRHKSIPDNDKVLIESPEEHVR